MPANSKVDLDNSDDVIDLFHESAKKQEMIEINNIIKCVNGNSMEEFDEYALDSQNSNTL